MKRSGVPGTRGTVPGVWGLSPVDQGPRGTVPNGVGGAAPSDIFACPYAWAPTTGACGESVENYRKPHNLSTAINTPIATGDLPVDGCG